VRRPRLAVLGGTFDHLHVGHHALLASAFRAGHEVAVGVTTDQFVAEHPKPSATRIQPYATRRAALVRWLRRNYPRRRWRVTALENPFGRSIDSEVGVLVVSSDTQKGGRAVNRERRRLGRRSVPLVVVPLVLGDDLEPVSSRRIRTGEVGPDGRRRAPLHVALSLSDRRDEAASTRAVRRAFPAARIRANTGPGAFGAARNLSRGARGTDRAGPPFGLKVEVVRVRPSGWVASVRSPRVRLRPRRIAGQLPRQLEQGLGALLRPRP